MNSSGDFMFQRTLHKIYRVLQREITCLNNPIHSTEFNEITHIEKSTSALHSVRWVFGTDREGCEDRLTGLLDGIVRLLAVNAGAE